MHSVEHSGYTPILCVVANRSLKINPSMEIRIKRNEIYSTIDITSWLREIIGPFGTWTEHRITILPKYDWYWFGLQEANEHRSKLATKILGKRNVTTRRDIRRKRKSATSKREVTGKGKKFTKIWQLHGKKERKYILKQNKRKKMKSHRVGNGTTTTMVQRQKWCSRGVGTNTEMGQS